mmetsp:Transcript_96068/g.271941  ORF Transcript_96068/g.271941 Transcript_96068/m.271941 type:complete len:280 (+) Transcript_96068:764-1603(+)
MLAVIVLRAENWMLFCTLIIIRPEPPSMPCRGPAAGAFGWPALAHCSLISAACPASESCGSPASYSERRAVCAPPSAPGCAATAASTTSLFARMAGGRCSSADPFFFTSWSTKSVSARSSLSACLADSGSTATHSRTKPLSDLRDFAAPLRHPDTPAFAASRTRPRSPCRAADAPPRAPASRPRHSRTNSRAPRRESAANWRLAPSSATAFRTRVLSPRSSSVAFFSALPLLCSTQSSIMSRSPRISLGACAMHFQLCIRVTRQQAWRQLLGRIDDVSV